VRHKICCHPRCARKQRDKHKNRRECCNNGTKQNSQCPYLGFLNADRALTNKAYAEYKAARKRSTDTEAAYRKVFDASLAKVDEGAPALQEKERAAFRERMLKARTSKKSGSSKSVAKADEDDDREDDEPTSPTKASN
jgi:hypothetical protein